MIRSTVSEWLQKSSWGNLNEICNKKKAFSGSLSSHLMLKYLCIPIAPTTTNIIVTYKGDIDTFSQSVSCVSWCRVGRRPAWELICIFRSVEEDVTNFYICPNIIVHEAREKSHLFGCPWSNARQLIHHRLQSQNIVPTCLIRPIDIVIHTGN